MKGNKRSHASDLIAVLFAGALFLSMGGCEHTLWKHELESDISRHPTPAWAAFGADLRRATGFSVAYYRSVSDDILLALVSRSPDAQEYALTEAIYEYDVAARTLSPATQLPDEVLEIGRWTHLAGWGLVFPMCGPLLKGTYIKGRCLIPPQDRFYASAKVSRPGRLAFVVSAEGPREEPKMGGPLSDGSRHAEFAYGQHYLQMVSLQSADFIGESIRIGVETARDRYGAEALDWLGGEDLIAIVPPSGEWLSVIHTVDLVGVTQPEK